MPCQRQIVAQFAKRSKPDQVGSFFPVFILLAGIVSFLKTQMDRFSEGSCGTSAAQRLLSFNFLKQAFSAGQQRCYHSTSALCSRKRRRYIN